MNYATWKLDFTNRDYGTGPEQAIAELGDTCTGAWNLGQAENDGLILGYVSEPQDEEALKAWSFTNISQEEALSLCLEIRPDSYLLPDGTIAA